MRDYLKIFLTFARIGAFTFGGGYSMLPMFQHELVEKHGWLTEAEMTDIFAVSQCLPGVIAINSAVFVGYRQKKLSGGVIAAFGAVLPSLVIILIIAAILTNFADIPVVKRAFSGISVCVCVLIINTVIKLWKNAIVDKPSLIIFAAVFLISVLTSLPTALLVIAAGVCGIAISSLRKEARK